MEAILADFVVGVLGARQGIHVGLFRHALVDGGIEHGHLRHEREQGRHRFDAHEVRRIMQRRQHGVALDGLNDVAVNDDRAGKVFTAMYHTVPHSRKIFETIENRLLAFG